MVGGGTGGFLPSDTDSSGRIVQWKSGATQANACVQPLLIWNPTGSNNSSCVSPAYAFAQNILPKMVAGKNIVIYTGAYSATGLCTGSSDPYWLPPSGIAYAPVLVDLPNLIAAYPDAQILIYWNQGENDGQANVTASLYTSTLTTLVSGIRGVAGASNALMIIDSLLPEFISSTFGGSVINLAEQAFPLAVKNCAWVGASPGFASADNIHYTSPGQRINGASAALLFPLIASLTSQAPGTPQNVAISGNNVQFNVPSSGAVAFLIETRPTGGSTWTPFTRYPLVFARPGSLISFRVPLLDPSTDVRVSSLSFGGQSAPSSVVTCSSGGWWRRAALVDIDTVNNLAYVNGTAYASIAAAITAGALSAVTGGYVTSALTIPSAFTMLGSGINPASLPASGTIITLMSVDDNASPASGAAYDFRIWNISGTVWAGAHELNGGTSALGNTTLMDHVTANAANQSVQHAFRVGAVGPTDNYGWSALGLSPPNITNSALLFTTLTRVRVGQAPSNTNVWTGTLGRMTLSTAVLPDDELSAQSGGA